MGPLDFIGNKLKEFGSDVEGVADSATSDVKNALGSVFGGNQPATATKQAQPSTPAPTTPQGPNPLAIMQSNQPQNPSLKLNFNPSQPATPVRNPAQLPSFDASGTPVALANTQKQVTPQNLVSGKLKTPLPTGTQSSVTPLSIAQGIARTPLEIAASVGNKTITPGTPLTKGVFGPTPIAPVQKDVAGVYQAVKAGHQNLPGGIPISPSLAAPFAVAAGLLHVAQDVPVLGGAAEVADLLQTPEKAAEVAAEVERPPEVPPVPEATPPPVRPTDTFEQRNPDAERAALEEMQNGGNVDSASRAYQQVSGTDPMTALGATARTLQDANILPRGEGDITALQNPLQIPNGLPKPIADAAQNLSDAYSRDMTPASDIDDLIRKAQGEAQSFGKPRLGTARDFEKTLRDNLAPAERQAVRDNLEGVAKPEEVTPKVQAVTDVAKQLNEKGYNIRDLAKPDGQARVKNYATRLARSNLSGQKTESLQVKMNNLKDIFNTDTRFGRGRQVNKYVANDGEVRFGTLKSTGLYKRAGEVKGAGKTWRPVATSTREIENSGVIKYEKDYGKIAGEYHSDTGAVKARYDALQQILQSPEKFGLSDEQEEGMVPIKSVPELDGLFASSKVVAKLKDAFAAEDARTPLQRGLDGVKNVVTQLIVLNPLIHGQNLAEQAAVAAGNIPLRVGEEIPGGPAGMVRLANSLDKLRDPEYAKNLAQSFFRDGGRLESYGSHNETVLSKAFQSADLPRFNKANAIAMEKIDTTLRLSLYDAQVSAGVDGAKAVKQVDFFLGDTKNSGPISHNIGLFYNYFRTQGRTLFKAPLHPVQNAGALTNLAVTGAAIYGAQAAFRKWTGNPNANLRVPGALGLVKDIAEAPGQIKQGEAPSVVTNHINPLITAGVNQLYGKDVRTGLPIQNTLGGRASNALTTLISPTQYTTKISSGKTTPAQAALQILTGTTLPHVKGAPAVPNFPNSPLNVKGSKPAQGADKTGITQANQYFNKLNSIQQSLSGSQNTRNASEFSAWLSRNHTSTGATLLLGPHESMENWGNLAANPTVLGKAQQLEKAQPDHNPVWDLSSKQLQTYAQYESEGAGEPSRTALEQKNPWLVNEFSKEQTWINQQIFTGTAQKPAGYVNYPNITPQQNQMMTQVTQLAANQNRTPAQETQLTTLENNQNLQAAYALLDSYTNKKRQAEGLNPISYPQQMSPQLEAAFNQYEALPSGTGARSGWIKANQATWNDIQDSLAASTLFNIQKQGAVGYEGGTPDASYLKDIYEAGQYDIAPKQNADGTTSYSVNPAAAYAASSSSGSSSSENPLIAFPPRLKSKRLKLKRAPKFKAKGAKLAKTQRRLKVTPAHTLTPTQTLRPTQVLKIR